MLREILAKGWNVEQTEQKIKSKIETKPKKTKTKRISQNLKIALNTLDQDIQMIEQYGVAVSLETRDSDDEIVYTIKIKK